MSRSDPDLLGAVRAFIEDALTDQQGLPLVVGICGAQGSGKSTLASALTDELERGGRTCAVLSLDDLYLTRAEREQLAREVHPLLATRGPPGTHDVPLGLAVLDTLRAGTRVRLPRFDKARDDRLDPVAWPGVDHKCDVVVFEGWCVGARAQSSDALAIPINALEVSQDPDLIWRRFVNEALAGPYQDLFGLIDRLVFLQAPSFEVVGRWREQQETELRASGIQGDRVMNPAQVAHFVQHYERITRHILAEMPSRADLVAVLDADRRPVRFTAKFGALPHTSSE